LARGAGFPSGYHGATSVPYAEPDFTPATRPMKSLRLVALCAVAIAACGKPTAGPLTAAEYSLTQAGDSIPLPLGKEVRVGTVWMVLSDVPSDSRCPRGAVCVWEGDAVAAIAVHPPCYKEGCKAPSAALELHTRLEPRAGEGWGHRVELLSLLPEPISDKGGERPPYVAWVRVTETSSAR
jgi:hypothetical protein